MFKRLGTVAAFAFAASVVACGAEDGLAPHESAGGENAPGSTGSGGVTIGPDGLPVGPDGKPLPAKLDGKYELSSEFDLTSAGVLPDVMNDTLSALSNFREKPSQTMVDLMSAANVPVVPNVLNAIPGAIRGFVLGYIDDHVFKALYEKVPVVGRITGILDDLASIVTKFELVTALDLPMGDAMGDISAKHTISGVGYKWDAKRHVIASPALLSSLVEQPVEANAVSLATQSVELESGRLRLGSHTFSVPIGTFAVYAVDELAKDKFGAANLRDALGKVVDCDKLADDVSARCIDPIGPGKVCVGHRTEVKQLCTTGLDLLVGTLKAKIKKLDLPVVNLEEGTAQMWDAPTEGAPLDATIDRLDRGFWTAKIKVTKEDKPVIAIFTGRRVGDTAQPSR